MARKRRVKKSVKVAAVIIGAVLLLLLALGYTYLMRMQAQKEGLGEIEESKEIERTEDLGTIQSTEGENEGEGKLSVYIFPAGKGQSILVTMRGLDQNGKPINDGKGVDVLIDGGEKEYGNDNLANIKKYIDGPLDVIVNTSPDAGYSGGLATIVEDKSINVDTIIYAQKGNNKEFREFLSAAESAKIEKIRKGEEETIQLGTNGATVNLLKPYPSNNAEREGDNGLSTSITCGSTTYFIEGNISSAAEKKLQGDITDIAVVVAGMSGSEKSNTYFDGSEASAPQYVIFSAAKKKNIAKSILKKYDELGVTMYGTFKDGTITFTQTGDEITLENQSKMNALGKSK